MSWSYLYIENSIFHTTIYDVLSSFILQKKLKYCLNHKKWTCTMVILKRKEWHETFLKMLGMSSMLTFIISMSGIIIYILLSQLNQYFIIQNMMVSLSFISLFILTLQTLRSMYHVYYLPLMTSCQHTYQKIIFFCCSFSMSLIVISALILSFSKMLKDYYP